MGFWYHLYHFCRQLLFEPLYLFTGYTPKKYRLSAAEKNFIEINKKYWPSRSDVTRDAPVVLVFGHMAGEGANYLLRLGMFSRSIAESAQARIKVVLPRCGYNSHRITELFRSFGISDFIFLRLMTWEVTKRVRALALTIWWYARAKDVESLLSFSFKGISFGDVIYNEIIHEVSDVYTIQKLQPFMVPFVFRFYFHLLVYEALLDRLPIRFLVTTHIQYTMFGTLVRLALARGVTVVETTDMSTSVFTQKHLQSGVDYFSYVRDQIAQQLSDVKVFPELIANAQKELDARMRGALQQMDAQLAYANKRNVEDAQLRELIGETRGRPLVTIFAHVFSDTPAESSRRTVYRDYYEWLLETLNLVVEIPSVHWILKPHPAQHRYGELEAIKKVFENAQRRARESNLSWCPEDLSTQSLIMLSHAIVTCQGTVGLESSCVGVPAVIAGAPFYREFGFTLEPRTKHDYAHALAGIAKVSALSDEQKKTALAVYGAFSRTTTAHENALIDPTLLDQVWGYRSAANSDAAYSMLANNLGKNNPREQKLFERGVRIAQGDFR